MKISWLWHAHDKDHGTHPQHQGAYREGAWLPDCGSWKITLSVAYCVWTHGLRGRALPKTFEHLSALRCH
jgi:hypothetical protein